MMDFKNNYIQYRLERVKETFEEAKTMANMGHWNTCVNRLYYEDLFRMDKEIARSYIEQTKAFIEKIENLIQEN